jgi:hypothetical protein
MKGWVPQLADRYAALLHTFTSIFHRENGLNLGSDLRFYTLSTAFLCGYYYYLYIYKSHFQADRSQITVRVLLNPMSARATA